MIFLLSFSRFYIYRFISFALKFHPQILFLTTTATFSVSMGPLCIDTLPKWRLIRYTQGRLIHFIHPIINTYLSMPSVLIKERASVCKSRAAPRIDRRCSGERRGCSLPPFSFDSEWGEVIRTTSRRVCINRHGLLRVFNPVRGGKGSIYTIYRDMYLYKKIFWREVLFTPLLWTCFQKSFSEGTDPVEVFIISLFELPIWCWWNENEERFRVKWLGYSCERFWIKIQGAYL